MSKSKLFLFAAATVIWAATATAMGVLSVDPEEELSKIKRNRNL